ncbi:MAG TPA: hypothetical protein VM866_02885 [Pyrinomonadaceae bacterium]|nr:hypothetical protein [Pyrinomonadaceae bacterium]
MAATQNALADARASAIVLSSPNAGTLITRLGLAYNAGEQSRPGEMLRRTEKSARASALHPSSKEKDP